MLSIGYLFSLISLNANRSNGNYGVLFEKYLLNRSDKLCKNDKSADLFVDASYVIFWSYNFQFYV